MQRLANGVVVPTARGRFVMPVVYVRVSSLTYLIRFCTDFSRLCHFDEEAQ